MKEEEDVKDHMDDSEETESDSEETESDSGVEDNNRNPSGQPGDMDNPIDVRDTESETGEYDDSGDENYHEKHSSDENDSPSDVGPAAKTSIGHDRTPRVQEAPCRETETPEKFSCSATILYFVKDAHGRIRVTNKQPTVGGQDISHLTAKNVFKLTPKRNLSKTKYGAFALEVEFLPLFMLVIPPAALWHLIRPFLQIEDKTIVNRCFEQRVVDPIRVGDGIFATTPMQKGSLIWPRSNLPLHDVSGINELRHYVDEDYVMNNAQQKNQKSVPYQLVRKPGGMRSIVINNKHKTDDDPQKVNSTKTFVKVSNQRALRANLHRANAEPFKFECRVSHEEFEYENNETKEAFEQVQRALNSTFPSAHGVMTTKYVPEHAQIVYPYDYRFKESMDSLAKEANAEEAMMQQEQEDTSNGVAQSAAEHTAKRKLGQEPNAQASKKIAVTQLTDQGTMRTLKLPEDFHDPVRMCLLKGAVIPDTDIPALFINKIDLGRLPGAQDHKATARAYNKELTIHGEEYVVMPRNLFATNEDDHTVSWVDQKNNTRFVANVELMSENLHDPVRMCLLKGAVIPDTDIPALFINKLDLEGLPGAKGLKVREQAYNWSHIIDNEEYVAMSSEEFTTNEDDHTVSWLDQETDVVFVAPLKITPIRPQFMRMAIQHACDRAAACQEIIREHERQEVRLHEQLRKMFKAHKETCDNLQKNSEYSASCTKWNIWRAKKIEEMQTNQNDLKAKIQQCETEISELKHKVRTNRNNHEATIAQVTSELEAERRNTEEAKRAQVAMEATVSQCKTKVIELNAALAKRDAEVAHLNAHVQQPPGMHQPLYLPTEFRHSTPAPSKVVLMPQLSLSYPRGASSPFHDSRPVSSRLPSVSQSALPLQFMHGSPSISQNLKQTPQITPRYTPVRGDAAKRIVSKIIPDPESSSRLVIQADEDQPGPKPTSKRMRISTSPGPNSWPQVGSPATPPCTTKSTKSTTELPHIQCMTGALDANISDNVQWPFPMAPKDNNNPFQMGVDTENGTSDNDIKGKLTEIFNHFG